MLPSTVKLDDCIIGRQDLDPFIISLYNWYMATDAIVDFLNADPLSFLGHGKRFEEVFSRDRSRRRILHRERSSYDWPCSGVKERY